jgi:hypothetical protein
MLMAVIFGENALSNKTIDALFSYIEDKRKKFVWASNFHLWSPALIVASGVVLTHKLAGDMTDAIFAELVERSKLPYHPKNGTIMFYSWFPGSSIAWHTDYQDSHSMTVYLNKDWNPDHGGYFCWREWDERFPKNTNSPPDKCRMRLPKYNEYVHMTDAEWHTTTITAFTAPPRLSLQMFFEPPQIFSGKFSEEHWKAVLEKVRVSRLTRASS